MKNYFYVLCTGIALIFLITSCGKEKIDDNLTKEDKFLNFSKSIILEDGNGNSADITIYANTQKALDDHDESVLHLVVNKRQKEISSQVKFSELEVQNTIDEDEKEDNFVYIEINNYDFKDDDVTGFKIKSDIEYLGQQSPLRYRETFYFYAYGADGVNGARVEYTSETQSKEYLYVKLSKKESSYNWFWQKLSVGKIYNVGDDWDYCGSTYWWKYKLKVQVRKAKAGVCCYGFTWEFLINC